MYDAFGSKLQNAVRLKLFVNQYIELWDIWLMPLKIVYYYVRIICCLFIIGHHDHFSFKFSLKKYVFV